MTYFHEAMAREQEAPESRCLKCGFTAPSGGTAWNRVDVPSLGALTQCPNCDSTDVTMRS